MFLKVVAKSVLLLALAGYTTVAMGKEEVAVEEEASEEAEDPAEEAKKTQWVDSCMKDSGWYNEDGFPYCQCIVGEAGTAKDWKSLKGGKIESTCRSSVLPSKADNPKRHWVADCIVSGNSDKYCKCMADKLEGPVALEEWKKTKAGSTADAACGG